MNDMFCDVCGFLATVKTRSFLGCTVELVICKAHGHRYIKSIVQEY